MRVRSSISLSLGRPRLPPPSRTAGHLLWRRASQNRVEAARAAPEPAPFCLLLSRERCGWPPKRAPSECPAAGPCACLHPPPPSSHVHVTSLPLVGRPTGRGPRRDQNKVWGGAPERREKTQKALGRTQLRPGKRRRRRTMPHPPPARSRAILLQRRRRASLANATQRMHAHEVRSGPRVVPPFPSCLLFQSFIHLSNHRPTHPQALSPFSSSSSAARATRSSVNARRTCLCPLPLRPKETHTQESSASPPSLQSICCSAIHPIIDLPPPRA